MRKSSRGNALLIVIVVIALLIAGYFVFTKVILPRLLGSTMNMVARQAVEKAIDIDFSKAASFPINQTINTNKLNLGIAENKGKITISSGGNDKTINGTIKYLGQKPTLTTDIKNQETTIVVKSIDQAGEDETIVLPTTIVTYLEIAVGAGKVNADLMKLNVTKINIAGGAGNVTVTLPQTVSSTASFASGVGSLTVNFSRENGIKVVPAQGLSFDNLDLGSNFIKVGNAFESKNYKEATIKHEVTIGNGSGGLNINRI